MIRLTDEEIYTLDEECIDCHGHNEHDVAKAQLKKIKGWGEEPCREHEHGRRVDEVPRRYCPECWQSLSDGD